MEKICIRSAKEADIEKLSAYINKFMLDGENLLPEQFVIAEIDGKLAGFGRIKPYDKLHELSSVGVLEEYRKVGVGSKIIRHIIDIFPENEIWITTKIPDYFKRFGFKESDAPPSEVKQKCKRICAYFDNSSSDGSYFMYLRK